MEDLYENLLRGLRARVDGDFFAFKPESAATA